MKTLPRMTKECTGVSKTAFLCMLRYDCLKDAGSFDALTFGPLSRTLLIHHDFKTEMQNIQAGCSVKWRIFQSQQIRVIPLLMKRSEMLSNTLQFLLTKTKASSIAPSSSTCQSRSCTKIIMKRVVLTPSPWPHHLRYSYPCLQLISSIDTIHFISVNLILA